MRKRGTWLGFLARSKKTGILSSETSTGSKIIYGVCTVYLLSMGWRRVKSKLSLVYVYNPSPFYAQICCAIFPFPVSHPYSFLSRDVEQLGNAFLFPGQWLYRLGCHVLHPYDMQKAYSNDNNSKIHISRKPVPAGAGGVRVRTYSKDGHTSTLKP